MSKYSLSEPATIFTTDGEFEFNTSSLNFETYLSSPASEEAEAITSSEVTPTSPRNSSPQDTSNSPTSISSNQPSRNSKQNFLSLFKKKDTSNSINTNPTTKPISALPQQSLVNANILAHDSNLDTTENTVQNNNDLEINHNVSRSIIGSVSVPDLPALNTNALDDEYNAMIKHQASDIGNHTSDGTHGLVNDFSEGKPSSVSSKKHKKRQNSIVSERMFKEDSGFKNTMKNTMRKTSTFFKKLGSKQASDNFSNQSERPPIPDFQVQNSQIVSSDTSHHIPATLNVKNDSLIPEPLSSVTTIDDSFSDNSASIDEKELLKRTLQEYSSVYVDYQSDDDNDRKSSLYRMSTLGANKSVPDNIGRTYSWNAQSSYDTTENIPINTNFATNFFDSKRVSGNTFMSLPVIRSEKKKAESKMVLEEIKTFSLSRVKEEENEDDVIDKKTSAKHSKTKVKGNTKNSMNNESVSTTHIDPRSPARSTDESSPSRKSSKKSFHSSKSTTSLFTSGSLMSEHEEHIALYSSLSAQQRRVVLNKSASHGSIRDMKDEDTIVDNRTLRANLDARGLSMKSRPGSETGTNYRLSQATIPKRPDKKLPDIPKIDLKSEADVSNSRSPHCQASSIASSCYETASGSTATLHTAPPSPVTDIIDPSNSSEGTTPKIQVDDVLYVSSPIDGAQYSFSDVPEKGAGEVSLSEAKFAAKRCFDEDETFVKKSAIAEFLGGTKALPTQALKFYMEYFDFSNLRIDMAFRRLCGKLYIKGETQQVDRILEAFSIRYWECNPKSIYGSADIVHAIAYSLLLLNTDLHIAQVSTKMSRQQFVRNTMAAIHAQINLAMHGHNESYEDDQSTITSVDTNLTSSTSITARPRRSGSIKSWRSNTNSSMTSLSYMPPSFSRQWDSELESLLKDIYTVIKSNQIVQPFSEPERAQSDPNTLSPTIQRSMSLLGHQSSRINALKKGIAAANARSRKNANGKVSPSPSFGSIGSESSLGADSLARSSSQTLPTLSSFSLRHASSSETALTSTIAECNEDEFDNDRASIDSTSTSESLELYLSGAPYAKEGLLVRKHYWDSTNKRAKDKYWKECFVVVEKGEIRMYKFDTQTSSGSHGAGAIGGGNWMANATAMGEVSLRHSITNALPPPGYNRSRPHVFALSMSNGGLYFFQAGTAELVDEWVSTCNYWAARTSKEPLTGGVSNMEYGWGRCLEPMLDGDEFSDRKSIMSDHRSIMSSGSTYATDRININEWKAPMPPSVSSNLDEAGQLAALKKYKEDLEEELEQHKNFWDPMSKLFSPRSSNHTKAFSNWEKKSQWLLYEIIKYTTYIECIENSIVIREKRRKERAKLKLKEAEINEKVNSLIAAESTDDEKRKEQKRAELRARARLSMKLLHRATWTPGDGFSLNLPKDLFGEEQLSDCEEESILAESINHTTKPKSGTAVIEDERRIGNVSDSNFNSGTKWVDRCL